MTADEQEELELRYLEEPFADLYAEINRTRVSTAKAKKVMGNQRSAIDAARENKKAMRNQNAPPGQSFSLSPTKRANLEKSLDKLGEKGITVYCAVPIDVKDTRMRNGDWVAIVREYAEEHGERMFDENYRIIENRVPAKHLYGNGDNINEWGYDNGDTREVYKNAVGNVKLAAVTYDDEGNVIPLSERFDPEEGDYPLLHRG